MAKAFGTKPADWLRTEQSERLIKAPSVSHNCDTADLVKVIQGGNFQGTWMHEDVALEFARCAKMHSDRLYGETFQSEKKRFD